MKRSNIIGIIAAAVVIIVSVVLISWYLRRSTPTLIQGTVECTTYKASSKVPGRIDDMKVEQGDRVEKGAAALHALDARTGSQAPAGRSGQERGRGVGSGRHSRRPHPADRSGHEHVGEGAGRAGTGAQDLRAREKPLRAGGVVPEQKMDEASANYKAMEATALAAKAQYNLAMDGARKGGQREAAAARVRQAEGAVSEVESYISDAMVYSPVTGEISTIIAEQGELVGSGYPVVAILDMSDMWVTFNIKETLLPAIRVGTRMSGYVPALGYDVEFEVTYIAVQADFATWSATRTQGGFDIRTFAVKAKPTTHIENMRPGMSVLVDFVLAYMAIGVLIVTLLSNLRLSLSIGGGYSVLAFTFSGLTFPMMAMYPWVQAFSKIFLYVLYRHLHRSGASRAPVVDSLWDMGYIALFIVLPMLCLPRLRKICSDEKYWGRM